MSPRPPSTHVRWAIREGQARIHERRAAEHTEWASAYDAIIDALEDIRARAEGDGSSPQFVTTINDEIRRAEAEANRLQDIADQHTLRAKDLRA